MPFDKQEYMREYMRTYRRKNRTPQAKQVHQACDAEIGRLQGELDLATERVKALTAEITECNVQIAKLGEAMAELDAQLQLERLQF